MSAEVPTPTTGDELIVLNSIFNSAVATSLMLGTYVVVYLGTVYIYLTKKSSRNNIVLFAITAMFIITVAQFAVQWAVVKRDLVNNDASRFTAFVASALEPAWQTLFNDFCGLFTSFLADGLLIWRCYNIWDGQLRVVAVSLFLLFTETSIYASAIILLLVDNLNPTTQAAVNTLNDLIGAALFITASTTSLSASLIAYRIYSLSRNDPLNRANKTFGKLVDVLIQSAAAYALISVWYAIETVIPETATNVWILIATDDYLFYIFPIVAGVASTSMVARVALIASSDAARSGIVPVSGLEFRAEESAATSEILSGVNRVYMIGGGDVESEHKEGERLDKEKGRAT
ncbi:hypothetical protein HYPSUDRAFT_215890 [Hypholoma sublateritium FD-334 SS-4]|uniref:Uncharacterized protein n=1 Tax=Hypholoma sublateritium (strain FD-334 SS-4) TaxID=945553 RepID=A0A0D2L621_HYPSF|nr:hypothetical protein HYPSUDRAFT_215890 [Hypholoma sublateritium FD-334 SS-4]